MTFACFRHEKVVEGQILAREPPLVTQPAFENGIDPHQPKVFLHHGNFILQILLLLLQVPAQARCAQRQIRRQVELVAQVRLKLAQLTRHHFCAFLQQH